MLMYDPIFVLNKNSNEKYLIKHQKGYVNIEDQNGVNITKKNLKQEVFDLIRKKYGDEIIIM
jgi:hypothetical protein